jgi:dihydropyrimidine dehydrogenase (NAD+) subunit PreT
VDELFTYQQARMEAERCLQCFDAPCTAACPTSIQIPKFIAMLRSANVRGAAEVVKTSNALANVCGKICPEEIYCQAACTRALQDTPIHIRELHYFATQYERRNGYSATVSKLDGSGNVAVVGAGPAGLSCASELAKLGHHVDLFDRDLPGGVPRKSIPAFRLSVGELDADMEFLQRFFTLHQREIGGGEYDQLRRQYDALFLAIGLGQDRSLGIDGEHLQGVVPVLDFLGGAKSDPEGMSIGNEVVVVGGGNVSLDAAATAKRLGASSVTLLYRRSEREMKVWKSEMEECQRQGVGFSILTVPVAIMGETRVRSVRCRRTRLSDRRDASGRHVPVEVEGTDFTLKADTVIVAIGQRVRAEWASHFDRTRDGFLKVNERFETSIPGVFAGGDLIVGEGTVVQSVAHGKYAAHAIHNYLTQ